MSDSEEERALRARLREIKARKRSKKQKTQEQEMTLLKQVPNAKPYREDSEPDIMQDKEVTFRRLNLETMSENELRGGYGWESKTLIDGL